MPSTFRSPTPEEQPWWWRLETRHGDEVTLDAAREPEFADQRFVSQSDAESWVGEFFAELAELGIDQVVLFENERRVYGPMSLHA